MNKLCRIDDSIININEITYVKIRTNNVSPLIYLNRYLQLSSFDISNVIELLKSQSVELVDNKTNGKIIVNINRIVQIKSVPNGSLIYFDYDDHISVIENVNDIYKKYEAKVLENNLRQNIKKVDTSQEKVILSDVVEFQTKNDDVESNDDTKKRAGRPTGSVKNRQLL